MSSHSSDCCGSSSSGQWCCKIGAMGLAYRSRSRSGAQQGIVGSWRINMEVSFSDNRMVLH